MSTPVSNGYFVELGEYSLILVKTNLSQRPRAVEELREVWLGDAPGVEAALKDLKGDEKGAVIALLRLKGRAIAAPDAGTSKRLSGGTNADEFLREILGPDGLPANWAIVSQKDGRNPSEGTAGLVDAVPTTSTDEALAKISGWSFDLQRCGSATLALTGALVAAARTNNTSILLVDVSETHSFLIGINAQGVTGFVSTPVGFDALAEATQTALGLKFRKSAKSLMFNESYDFSEAGPKIIEPLANAIRSNLGNLGNAPATMVVSGVLARQTWLTVPLATAVGLKNFSVDVAAWASAQGLALGSKVPSDIAPTWLGVLGSIAAYDPRNPGAAAAWNPVFSGTPVAASVVVPALAPEPTPPPAPIPVVIPAVIAPTPAPKPVVVPAPIAPPPAVIAPAPIPPAQKVIAPIITPPAKTEPKIVVPAPKPAVVITPPPKPVEAPKPVAAKTPPPPAKPVEPKPVVPTKPVEKAVVPAKVEPKVAVVPIKVPVKPEVTKPAAPAAKPTLSPAPAPVAPKGPTAAPFPKKKSPILAIIVALLFLSVLAAGGYFWNENKKETAVREARENDLKQRAATEAAARRAAEEKTKQEEAAHKKDAEEAAQRAVAAEKARVEAEERARVTTTQELLNARGSLTVNTNPPGASIAVGELAPRTSPANVKDLRLGHYSVAITLAGYDSEQRDVDIKANEVADLGTVSLHRQIGAVEITSDPVGLAYELKPAGALFVNPADVRKGQTPATLSDVPVGTYQLTVTKPNWPNYVATITVERNGSAKANSTFQGGTITITSTPPGSNVMRDQTQIGVTPLTLSDQIPGDFTFTVTQRGLEPATVTGHVEAGKTLALNATLLDVDRVMKLSELDERPVPLQQVEPELSSNSRAEGGSATIEFVVGVDGVPADLRVVNASNVNFGRACLAAAAKWRFRPGTVRGKAVRTHISLPFRMAPET